MSRFSEFINWMMRGFKMPKKPRADTQPPSTPGGLIAAATGTTGIALSWTRSTDNVGVSGYWVYRGGVKIATVTLQTYGDTNLAPATTYTYQVRAYDAAGKVSALSASASATTDALPAPPPPPPPPPDPDPPPPPPPTGINYLYGNAPTDVLTTTSGDKLVAS